MLLVTIPGVNLASDTAGLSENLYELKARTYYLLVMVMEWKWTYIVPLLWYLTLKALRYRSHSFTCKLHRICLYLVSIHQMAPPQTEVADI